MEWVRGEYVLTDEIARFDRAAIHELYARYGFLPSEYLKRSR